MLSNYERGGLKLAQRRHLLVVNAAGVGCLRDALDDESGTGFAKLLVASRADGSLGVSSQFGVKHFLSRSSRIQVRRGLGRIHK